MEGLAQQMAGAPAQQPQPQPQPQPQQQPQVDQEMLQQVMQLLMNGVDPQELVKQGIPPEVIMQAIEMLEQEMATQQAPEGLAQSMIA